MSPFDIVCTVAIAVIAVALLSAVVLMFKTNNVLNRVVLSDMVFYSIVCIFVVWTLTTATSIGFEVALLSALVAGVLPTISLSRIVSRGRR